MIPPTIVLMMKDNLYPLEFTFGDVFITCMAASGFIPRVLGILPRWSFGSEAERLGMGKREAWHQRPPLWKRARNL